MSKVIKGILCFLFAFAFLFLFTACGFNNYSFNYMTPLYNNSASDSASGGESGGGSSSGSTNKGYNPEFYLEDGVYSYFAGYWEEYSGVRLASNPNEVETGNPSVETKEERQKYFDNISNEFDLLTEYILHWLNGTFNEAVISKQVQIGDFDEITFLAVSPIIFNNLSSDEEYNKTIGFTSQKMVSGAFDGWEFDGTNLTIKRDNTHKFLLDFSSENETAVKNFVKIRLMEIALNKTENITTFSEASNPDVAQTIISGYLSKFLGLGLDYEQSALKDFFLKEIVGSDGLNNLVNYYSQQNRYYDEPYTDIDDSGEIDEGEYFDINQDGAYTTGISAFKVDFSSDDGVLKPLLDGIKAITDQIPNIICFEVQDIVSESFFHPGTPETETEKRKLTNMDYSEYKSAVYVPQEKAIFDTLEIYVDSQQDFVLNIYLKVFIDEHNYFIAPICFLNLDHTKSCDWQNEQSTKEYQHQFDELFDTSVKHNSFSLIYLDQLFEYLDDYVLVTEQTGKTDAEIMYEMVSQTGINSTTDLSYQNRGYHTHLKQDLDNIYSYQTIKGDQNHNPTQNDADKVLCYNSSSSYMEFIFEIPDKNIDSDYNFKFLIKSPILSLDNEEDEQN